MDKLSSILVIADRGRSDIGLLQAAVELARVFGAVIELCVIDSEGAADLRHPYDAAGAEKQWRQRVLEGRDYLETLRSSVPAPDVQVFTDAMCHSRIHEGILSKIDACHPDLVMKSAAKADPSRRFCLDDADWELMRACPVTLMLLRGRKWSPHPRFAAMIDVSESEDPVAAERVLHAAGYLAAGCGAELDVAYSEQSKSAAACSASAAALSRIAREYRVSPNHVHLLSGEPDETLPAFAARGNYDMLVLGALTHRKALATLVGKLTGRFVATLDCDILLVKKGASASKECKGPLAQAAEEERLPPDTAAAAEPHHAAAAPILWEGLFGD